MNSYERYEIVQMYKEAADKNKQIKILAQLNCCSEGDILNILVEEGAISGVSKKMANGTTPKTEEPPANIKQGNLSGQAKVAGKRQSERGKWTKERLEEVQKMIDEGLTYDEIGERMGTDKIGIKNAIARHGLRGRSYREQPKVKYDTDSDNNVKAATGDSKNEREKIKLIENQNRFDDIAVAAKVIYDIMNLICNASEEEMEDYENTINTMCYSAGQMAKDIILKAEGLE